MSTPNVGQRRPKTLAEEDRTTKLSILHRGPSVRIRLMSENWKSPGDETCYLISNVFLEHRCPRSSFDQTGRFKTDCQIPIEEADSLELFILWLYYDHFDDMATTVSNSGRSEDLFVNGFIFAKKYSLSNFAKFLVKQFSEFAPLYYGQDAKDSSSNFPSVDNVAKVYNNLVETTSNELFWFNGFFIEQCARSLLYRNAYNDDDVDVLVVSHPEAARAVFKQIRVISPVNQGLSVATFLGTVGEVEAKVNGHANEENTVTDDAPVAKPSEVSSPDAAVPDEPGPEPESELAVLKEPAAETAVEESSPKPVSEHTAQTSYGASWGVPSNNYPTPDTSPVDAEAKPDSLTYDPTTSERSNMYKKNGKLKKRKASAQVAVAEAAFGWQSKVSNMNLVGCKLGGGSG